MQRLYRTLILLLLFKTVCIAQDALIEGVVIDKASGIPLSFVNVSINDQIIIETDSIGNFSCTVPSGYHKLSFSYLSYEPVIVHQIKADPIKPSILEIQLMEVPTGLNEIVISEQISPSTIETPLSIKSIGVNEITRFPGATLDVSKIIKSLPGVLPKVSFGYNIIVRGGASHENKFYIDGIELPSINHFSVQGVSGGPNGMINVDLLSGADLITGAFPANRYNALSSVLDLKTRTARMDRIGGKFTLGATDVGLSLEGPLNHNTSFIFSARKSFSEYYLKAFKLPVLPAYTDYNFKLEKKWNRAELKIIGIGAFDQSRLNLDDATTEDASDRLQYNVGYIPEGDQSVHTLGLNYKKYADHGYMSLVASSSYFKNSAIKYFDNSFAPKDLWFDYDSRNLTTKFRLEKNIFRGKNQLRFGVSAENLISNLKNYSQETDSQFNPITIDFNSGINIFNYGVFVSSSYKLLADRLDLFAGIRADASTYGERTSNLLNQVSPRLSLNYKVNSKINLSANLGSYYQLPPTVLMTFSENDELVNENKIGYINANQAALGLNYSPNQDKLFSIETFYKAYRNYPFLLRDSISFANANADYVVVGNQKANDSSEGRAYGLELFFQKKFTNRSLWSAAYTYSVSEFKDKNDNFVSSSWDTRHFLSLIYSQTFGKNWQFGAKFSYASASPYTPYNESVSSKIEYWDINRKGAFDYNNLNSASLSPFYQLDIRFDKNYYYKKWTMNLYIDIANVSSSAIEFIPYLTPVRGEDNIFEIDPSDSSRYLMELVSSDSGRVLPTIGIIAEF